MTLYRFDPAQMVGLADDLRRAADRAGAASFQLLAVPTYGLPPEAKGLVEGQTRSLWRLLARGEAVLTDSSRYLTRMSTAVRKADDATLRAAGLDVVRVTKGGKIIIEELGDRATRTRRPLGERGRRWASLLGTLSDRKAIDQMVSWSQWHKALRDAKVDPRDPVARQIAQTIRHRAAQNVADLQARQPGRVRLPFDPDEGKWKRWVRRVVGLSPGPVGDIADGVGYLAASHKLRTDEPQTGLSQALTDIRDFTDLMGASGHVATDLLVKTPITAPAAPITEGIALVADGATLTMDTANEARKGLGATAENFVDGLRSLSRPPWAR